MVLVLRVAVNGTLAAVTLHAITVLGQDRPGIIASTTGALAELGLNIEDSTMTLLRGHFAMMLITQGTADAAQIEQSLSILTEDGTLSVSVRALPEQEPAADGQGHLLSVHGGDRPGIVSTVIGEVAAVGGNVTNLMTRLVNNMYVLTAEVDLPAGVDPTTLQRSLRAVAEELGVGVSLTKLEADDL